MPSFSNAARTWGLSSRGVDHILYWLLNSLRLGKGMVVGRGARVFYLGKHRDTLMSEITVVYLLPLRCTAN